MARTKLDYGIDLGTTNSAIARIENGVVKIIKSDTQEDTMPSCVHFRKTSVRVGRTAYNRISDEHLSAFSDFSRTGNTNHTFNTFVEFKRTMGTDKDYPSDSAGRSFSSEELSAEVLKTLKSFVRDEEVSSIVITVPARFRNNQIDATQKAAELAGFKYCELLAEPIAASIAFGVSSKKISNGYYLVVDFGGGTFDVALMQVEEGITKVLDTDGDNHLGGKDLDYAIVDSVIIPYLKKNYRIETLLSSDYGKRELREALKFTAEEAKIAISPTSKLFAPINTYKPLGEDDDGNQMEIDMKMTLQEFELAAAPVFQRAIDISKSLIHKNNLKASELEIALLVGGPTLSQTMRKMLQEQLEIRIDTSIDPMTAVAVGAALFASSKDIPSSIQRRDREKIQVILKYPPTSVETEIHLGIKIDRAQTNRSVPARLFAEVSSKDKFVWSSGRVEVIGDAEIITVPLLSGNNNFEIAIFDEQGDSFPCEPTSFSIRQGSTDPDATLPFSLGIKIYDEESGKGLLHVIDSLAKNRTLPAKGKAKYKTQKDIRPGFTQDKIRVPILEGEADTRAILNEPAGYVIITGDDLPKFLPKGSEVEISLSVDRSRRITASIYFPDLDETIVRKMESSTQGECDADELENEISKASSTVARIESESTIIDLSETGNLKCELEELSGILTEGRADYETKLKVMERLREVLKTGDRIEEDSEWPRVEDELNDIIEALLIADQRYGSDGSTVQVKEIQQQSKAIIKDVNVKMAKNLTREVRGMIFRMNWQQLGYLVSYIKYYDESFNDCNWTNRSSARKKVDEAKVIIAGNPTVQKLQNKIEEIWEDLPDHTPPPTTGIDDEFLTSYR
jgi:molecular chaperone DnaK